MFNLLSVHMQETSRFSILNTVMFGTQFCLIEFSRLIVYLFIPFESAFYFDFYDTANPVYFQPIVLNSDHVKGSQSSTPIITFSSHLDSLLGGGILPGEVTNYSL